MYGKPHLSIWGEPFDADRPLENMGVRHQGIAASLMPGEPVRLPQLLAAARRATAAARRAIAGPIARRSRRPTSAPRTSTACAGCARSAGPARRSPRRSIAAARSSIARRRASCRANDWQAPHHAALLIAFAHLDVGRHRRGDRARRRRDRAAARRRGDAGSVRVGAQADLALEDRRRPARARVRVGGLPPRRSGPRDRRAHARPDHRRRRRDDA